MIDYKFKDKYNADDLNEIVRILRSENGCPWDKVQTHESVRNDLLEEAYEVADAIDSSDSAALCEELGDLLLQVAFHANIAREDGQFDFDDVADGICKKMIHRHPHVFGEVTVNSVGDVLDNWDDIKKREKSQSDYTDTLVSVPKAFPALMRAQKVQKRAAKAGFDWEEIDGAWAKLAEETSEVKEAVESGDEKRVAEEFGDLLFSAVNVSRFLKVDAESALAAATEKFISRFAKVEKLARERGIDMKSSSLEELDELWNEVKKDS